MKLHYSIACILTAAAFAAAPNDVAAPSLATQGVAKQGVAPDSKGVVQGRIVFDGSRPEPKKIDVDPAKAKGCVHEGETLDTHDLSLLIDKDGGIANVVITVEVPEAKGDPGGAKLAAPAKPIVIDQKKCVFEPHVLLVPAGTTIDFVNSDEISHNVHIYPAKNDPFNQTVVPGGKYSAKFEKADKVNVKCDLHPWMSSWLVVVDSPYTALSKPDGTFRIEGLPAGDYRVTCWQESLGKVAGSVKIKDDGTSDALEIKMAVQKKRKP